MGSTRLILLMVAMTSASIFWDVPVLDRVVIALAVVLFVCWIWNRFSLVGLGITRAIDVDRLHVGESVTEHITLINQSWLPKPWLVVEDDSDLPGHEVGSVVSLRGCRALSWAVSTPAVRRGRFRLGAANVSTSDPVGLFSSSRVLPVSHEILVLPARLDVSSIPLPTAQLSGGRQSPRLGLVNTAMVRTVRDYVPGDAMSRIAWKTTAHRGQLMVKELEPDPTADVWILLDLNDDGQFDLQQHADAPTNLQHLHTTVEYTIALGFSLAAHALGQGRRVGVILSRQDPIRIDADNSERQLNRIGETLAVATSRGHRSITESLRADSRRFSRTTGLILVTADPRSDWVAAGAALVERLVPVTAVIVDAGGEGQDSVAPLITRLASARVHVHRYPTFTALQPRAR